MHPSDDLFDFVPVAVEGDPATGAEPAALAAAGEAGEPDPQWQPI